MTTRLIQTHLLKGTQEFEIIDDAVNIHIKPRFKGTEKLTVMLSVLNAEPVISKSRLEFTSRVNNEPLVSLYLAKPNAEEFNTFVNLLKQKIQDEFNAFAGLKSAAPQTLGGNVFEEPPEFDSPEIQPKKEIDVEQLSLALRTLSEQIDTDQIAPFVASVEAIIENSRDKKNLTRMIDEFHALGAYQGAVLTYAPYINALMSDDPFSKR